MNAGVQGIELNIQLCSTIPLGAVIWTLPAYSVAIPVRMPQPPRVTIVRWNRPIVEVCVSVQRWLMSGICSVAEQLDACSPTQNQGLHDHRFERMPARYSECAVCHRSPALNTAWIHRIVQMYNNEIGKSFRSDPSNRPIPGVYRSFAGDRTTNDENAGYGRVDREPHPGRFSLRAAASGSRGHLRKRR